MKIASRSVPVTRFFTHWPNRSSNSFRYACAGRRYFSQLAETPSISFSRSASNSTAPPGSSPALSLGRMDFSVVRKDWPRNPPNSRAAVRAWR